MAERTIWVKCPECGHAWQIRVTRQNKKGEGAYYGSQIKKLTPQHQLIIDVLKFENVYEDIVGLPWHKIYPLCRETAINRQMKIPTSKGLSGRLSELVGAGIVETAPNPNIIDLKDRDSMQFRHRNRKEQVYWLHREEGPVQTKIVQERESDPLDSVARALGFGPEPEGGLPP